MRKTFPLYFALFCLFSQPLFALNPAEYVTPDSPAKVAAGTVTMTLDGSGKAVGASSTNPIPVTVSSGSVTGTVAISQTTPGTTNGVNIAPSSGSAVAITPVVSASAESSHVLKSSAGNLYSVYAVNLTATSGFLQVFNATSAPTDGAVTPIECIQLPPLATSSINYGSAPPARFSTGIVAVVSSATTCFTKTTGTITAFIHGVVQ